MTSHPPSSKAENTAPDGENDGRPSLASLGARIRGGFGWNAASSLTTQASRTALMIVLARLLTPADFGVAGMVLVFSGLILLLGDLGLSASLVQFDSLTEEDRSTAFWTGLFLGLFFFGVTFLVAPQVADFYGEQEVRWMLVTVSTAFVLGALSATQAALFSRRMDFRALEVRHMVSTMVSVIAGIGAALAGLGPWSLIVQSVSYNAVSTVLIWVLSPWKPSFVFSSRSLRRMGSFGANVFLARFAYYADRNVDNVIVAKVLGPSELGIYSIGYSAILVPLQRLLSPLQAVLTPTFAHLKDDLSRTRDLWMSGVRLAATLIFPTTMGIIIVSPDAVAVILGSKWTAATPVIQILAWVVLIQSLNYLNAPVFQSLFQSGLMLRLAAFSFVVDLAAFGVGVQWGVVGVAAAYAVVNTVLLVPLSLLIVLRRLGITARGFATELRGIIEATCIMTATLIALRLLLVRLDVGGGLRLILLVAVGTLVYLLMCMWRERRVFSELRLRQLRDSVASR